MTLRVVLCGVDEAGRGPAMGPLVVAAVAIPDDAPLREIGVKDSKKLPPKRRFELSIRIREMARVEVRVVQAEEIDAREHSLNELEAELFAELLDRIAPTEAFLDACDTDESRFARTVGSKLRCHPRLVAKHKADDIYPVVSAASIIAKTVRDEEMERICSSLGIVGMSGYCGDKRTNDFVEGYLKEHGSLPPHTRRSWKNIRKLSSDSKVSKLSDWE
jgi:ribonuclease HII